MSNKLLIINTTSYIPMGSLGVCDYLDQRGLQSKILNIPYPSINPQYLSKLIKCLNEYEPSHICILFHWKESVKDFIYLGQYIKKTCPKIIIFTGGFSAGYFAKSLLLEYQFLDYVINGDPEVPTLYLVKGDSVQSIPNLVYRKNGKVYFSGHLYVATSEFLSGISFSKLEYIFDHEEYLQVINTMVGFPIFIGRKCKYNCLFCGGSADAFLRHSKRKKIVVRSVASIIKDLVILKKYTNFIYIGYESSQKTIMALLKVIGESAELRQYYYIAYSTWSLLTPKEIMLFAAAFKYDGSQKSLLEISPETSLENDRKKIRDRRLYYSNKKLLNNIKMLVDKIGPNIKIHLFFSRYHITQHTLEKLKLELAGIIKLRDRLCKYPCKVVVFYMHLATDIGSFYWEKKIADPTDIKSLIKEINKKELFEKNNQLNLDNYCFFYPDTLSAKQIIENELLIQQKLGY